MPLHLAGLRRMLLRWEKHWISSTIQFKYDGEFLGMISRIVRSSTYFARLGHVLTRSLTITENSTGPNLVPWGIPPFRERILEESEPMRTDCERPWRKAAIHLTRQGCRLQECSLLKRMVWSIRSNPFLKSTKESCTTATTIWGFQDQVEYTCNCMLGWHSCSCELFTIKIFINAREWPRESKAFHYFRHLVRQEIGLMSFSTDLGVICLVLRLGLSSLMRSIS